MCIAISKITKILKLLHKLVLHENQNNFSISVLSIEQISYCYLLLKEFPLVFFLYVCVHPNVNIMLIYSQLH